MLLLENKFPQVLIFNPHWLKINVDAATNVKRNCFGLGAIIRDSTGKCIVASIKTATFKDDVLYAKTETSEWGVCITKEVGIQSVILETDSQALANLINNNGGNRTEIH